MTEQEQLMRDLANSALIRTDYRILKAIAPMIASAEWCVWRDQLRSIWNNPEGVSEIPAEPAFGFASTQTEPDPVSEVEPAQHFADLMLADETADDARVRLSQRLRELRHYLMAPEIRVNEDGSLGLTGEEQSELQDLERRQTLGRWLDA
jgi:hypothetical protein